MAEFLGSPLASIVFLLALTATLVVIGAYIIGRVRSGLADGDPQSSQLLTNFKEMHAEGKLSDEEFRTIKAMLADRLQHELNDADRPR